MRTHAQYTATAAAAGAALTLLLTACGQESDGAAQDSQLDQETSSSQSAPPSSTSQPSSSEQSASSTEEPSATSTEQSDDQGSAPGAGLCKAGDLKVSLGTGAGGAAGTAYGSLQFHNVGAGPCDIQGYPGVSYVAGDDGHQVGPAAFREGKKGPAITLQPGDWSHVDIGFVQVRNYDPGVCKPTPVRGLRVYVPQETQSQYVPLTGKGSNEGCAGSGIPGNQLTVGTMQQGQSG